MLEKFIKTYSGNYKYTSMVRHTGVVIAFAMDANRHIWYTILDMGGNEPPDGTKQQPKSFLDVDAWQASSTKLIFPNEIAEVGFGVADQTMLPVFKKNSTLPEVAGTILPPGKEDEFDYFNSTTARFSAEAPFQVLSDGRYIYVFRQAIDIDNQEMVYVDEDGIVLVNKGDEKGFVTFNKKSSKNEWVASSDSDPAPLVNKTLLVDRFLLTGTRLTPKMEVRYQRSRSKTRPASRKDSLGPKDLDGNFFYEPTQELRFISNLTGGHFSVLLLPTAIAEIQRWQIFAENSITHTMDSYNVERSEDGLFNTRGSQTYTCVDHPQIYTRRDGICSESECGKPLIPRIVTKGYSEWALKFNGSTGSVSIANKSFLDFEDEITVEAWIKPNKPIQQTCIVAKDKEEDDAHDYSLGTNASGQPFFAATVDGSRMEMTSGLAMVEGTWYHIAGTFDGGAVRIFVNGNKEKGETKATGKLSKSVKNLSFARSSSATPSPFAGIIDEVRIWRRARTESEILADMHQRLTGLESDLVGYWRFDEGSGGTVHDQTNNQMDGTIHSAQWIPSTAPVGEHPGIERTSFRIEGRTFETPPTSLLYYQQSKAAGGYSGEERYLKNAGRVMLAVATNDGSDENVDKNHIAALDFGVSASGRLAQVRDIMQLDLLNPEQVVTNESINDTLDRIAEGTAAAGEIQTLKSKLKDGSFVTMPRVQTDSLGLTISGGVLGFAWTEEAPLLFDSATGRLALYFRGGDDQFFVAYYDTFTERARIKLLSNGKDAVTCFSTSSAYDKITMQIQDITDGQDDTLSTVKVQYRDAEGESIISETWEKVPRDSIEFSKVMNGQATGQSYIGSGEVKNGELTLSDPRARRAIKVGTTLKVGKERIEVRKQVFSGEETLIHYQGDVESTVALPVFYVEYDYAVNASCEGADLSNGSILIRAIPAGNSGQDISNTAEDGIDLETSLVCKWTAAAPGSTISFDGKTQHAEAMESNKPDDFDAVRDLTLEAWVKPGQINGRASLIRHQSSDSNYMLALEKVRSALVFDGKKDNYVEIPHAEQISFAHDQDFTIEAWVKTSPQQIDSTRSSYHIITKGGGIFSYPYAIHYETETGKIVASRQATANPSNFTPELESKHAVNDDVFHHVAFVKNGRTLRLYIDANGENFAEEDDTTLDAPEPKTTNASKIRLARRSNTEPMDNHFKGAIDEVRIWKRARTLEEIQGDMYRRLTGTETDLVGYWHFENVENNKAKDYSRFRNNGTINGNPKKATTPLKTSTAVVGVREKIVQTREVIPGDKWSHMAAVYERTSSLKFGLGGDGYLDCGNSDTLNINGDLTIEVSFQIDDLNTDRGILTRGKFGSPGQNVPYSLAVNKDGFIEFLFEDVNGKEHILTSSESIKDEIGRQHHLMVSRERKLQTYSEPFHRDVNGTMIEFHRSITFVWDELNIFIKSNLPDADVSHIMERYVYNDDEEVKQAIEMVLQGNRPDQKFFPPEELDHIQWKPDDIGRSNLPLEIGRSSDGSFKGTIMEVRIWNVAREANHFDITISGEEGELVSWWRFQERWGTKTNDSKGQNHATFKGLIDWVPNPDPQKSILNLTINGKPVETDAINTEDTDTWVANTDQFTLGARKSDSGFDQHFQGELEEVRLWGTTRTEEQIQDNLFRRIQGEKEDLIAYYTFDAESENQVSDYSLRGNHLALKGSALVFDGVNDHVEIPNNDKFNFGKDQDFTVEAWVKASPTQADIENPDNDIIEKWSGSKGYPFVIRLNNETGHITAARYDGDPKSEPRKHHVISLRSAQALNDGMFHHVAFAKDGSTLKLYIDGNLDAVAKDEIKGNTDNTSHLYLGCRGGNKKKNFFKGAIDEVRIWNNARDQQDIQNDMYRRLGGDETNLVGYWHFENGEATDYSILPINGTIKGKPERSSGAIYVLSTAPIGDDTPQVRSALAGIHTPFSGQIGSTPSVQEYGDMQLDSQGNLIGVFKRCYSFIQDGKWQIITAYKVGDMVTEWIGQVQFAPQLMGFIEGAPPVPSENLTQPSVELIGDLDDYNEASIVELAEAQETTYTYSSTKEGGFDMEWELGLKFGVKSKTAAGAFLISSVEDSKFLVGPRARFESSWGWSEEASTGVSRTTSKNTSLELRGRYTMPEEITPAREPFGRRFVPDNVGLAVVQSETADVFALRLKHNGALIAFQMRPNPDIPKDWNIIHFPINPRYIKQGTLDGKIGPVADVDYPKALTFSSDSSYFKPLEAYTIKNRIQREETALQTYYAQYAAQDRGRPASMPSKSVQDITGLQALAQKLQRNLINTYVWTTDGGLFAETQQTMEMQSETFSGSYDFKGMAGVDLTVAFAIMKVASQFELNAMFGGHQHLSVNKSKESKTAFQLKINLDKVERDIYKRDPKNQTIVLLDKSDPKRPKPIKYPGKVDAYRFMSFYLEPSSDHFDDFFNLVVDPIWLEQSDDPNAVTLRGARDDNKEQKPEAWRVMHRVTYVSRVLPPLDLSAPPSLEKTLQTLDIDSNYELIKQLDPYVRDHRTDFSEFTQAVDRALETYLPELKSHHKEIKQYLSLFYGIDEYMLPPEVKGISENPEIEPVHNQPPSVKAGQYTEALKLAGPSVTWEPDTENQTFVSDDRLEKTEDLFLTWDFIPDEGKEQQATDVSFDDPHTLKTKATFQKKGQYRLRLTASDGLLSADDETVLVVNQTPTIVIDPLGAPESIAGNQNELKWEVTLQCEINTGLGVPETFRSVKLNWSVESGIESNVSLDTEDVRSQDEDDGNLIQVTKKITFKESGFYLLKCTVDNGSLASDSEINLEIAARVTESLQALYTFENGSGTTIPDVSGSATPLDLTVSEVDAISRGNGWLEIHNPAVLSANAIRITEASKTKNEITLEAWIEPALDNAPGLRRILTMSNGPAARNFILAQSGETFHAGLRTSDGSSTDGNASLRSIAGGVVKSNKLIHLVFTRGKNGKAKLYIDSKLVSERNMSGDFSHWDESFQLALGNELNSDGRADRAWPGKYHLVAIYNRELSADEISQNFDFGSDRDLPPQVSAGNDMEVNWSIPGIKNGDAWLKDGVSIDEQNRLTLELHGVVRHDRPTAGKVMWSKISGPPDVVFDNFEEPGTMARFPSSGAYKFRLTAEDDIGQVVSKEITIIIFHETPLVEIDIPDENLIVTGDKVNTVTLEEDQVSLKLRGAVKNSQKTDYPPGKLKFEWSCVSKNSEHVVFDDVTQLETNVSFTRNGVYELMLTAENQDDKEKKPSASIQITVNQPPVVEAGPDQNLLMSVGDTSINTHLDGTVSDDGLPDPPSILKLKWSVQDGAKDDVAIVSENADFTEVQFKREGDYTLKLEADDSAVKVSDTVKITVENSGMLPGGGRQAKVTREAGALTVRVDHNKHAQSLYHLKEGQEVTVIDLWTNDAGDDTWARINPVENPDKQPQWCAMKIGQRTLLDFTE